MRFLSPTALSATFKEESQEVIVFLLDIDYGSGNLRFCNNTSSVTHNGDEYLSYRFDINLPDEADKNRNEVELSIDNIDGLVLGTILEIESVIKVTMKVVMHSTPDVVEAGPFVFDLIKLRWNAKDVIASLILQDLLTDAFPGNTVNPSTHPAVF